MESDFRSAFLAAPLVLFAVPAVAQLAGGPEVLLSATAQRGDFFGASSALWGDRLAVGAMHAGGGRGAVYVFERGEAGWTRTAELHPAAGANPLFGIDVALVGDTLMAGDSGAPAGTNRVHVFENVGGEWLRTQALAVSGAPTLHVRLLALAPDVAVVGAPFTDHPAAERAGAIHVFERVGEAWQETSRIFAARPVAGAQLGGAAAVSGDWMVVGEKTHEYKDNNVYFLHRGAQGWAETQRARAADGARRDLFGKSVALRGEVAVVGAPERPETFFKQGAAYVFELEAGRWHERAKLVEDFATPGWFGNRYGSDVAVTEDAIAVGAPRAAPTNAVGGQAFLYARGVPERWVRTLVVDGSVASHLGTSVALDERWLAIGVPDSVSQAPEGPRVLAWRRDTRDAGAGFCPPSPSSTGRPVELRAVGSEHLTANDLRIRIGELPQASHAVLLASFTINARPSFGGGRGLLCLGDPLLRVSAPLPPAGIDHSIELPMDLGLPPFDAIAPGQALAFQLWFRDAGSSNTSSAVVVRFR